MLKSLNRLAIFVFIIVAALAPYVSAKGAALAFAQNPEEKVETSSGFEQSLSLQESENHFVAPLVVAEHSYPHYIALKPQLMAHDFRKPPHC